VHDHDDHAVRRYVVTIFYTEPLYAAQRGIDVTEYRGSFTVYARDEDGAISRATDEFRAAARASGVQWPRQIVRTTVQEPAQT